MSGTKKTLFDYLNAIFYKKDLKYDKKIANGYKLTLWLSHDKNLIYLTNRINQILFSVPDNLTYNYFYYEVPKGRRYISYVKKDKGKNDKRVKELMKQYEMSEREVLQCLID